ncbi:MAG: DUF4230 domain-containing protein [Dehalococcoidia bacterium]
MSEAVRYLAAPVAARVSPVRAAGWLTLLATAAMIAFGGYLTWRWADDHIFSLGIEDAGTTTVNHAELVERVQAFELVTAKDTFDTRSNTDFHKRLNLGVTKLGLPGFIAGQELDVKARVTVAAGVDLSQVTAQDVEVIQNGDNAVVIVRIPEAQITSTEVDPDSFDISTSAGLLTRVRSTVGLGERDVRDGALESVTTLAREEALAAGIADEATRLAREQLQAFLQALPQTGEGAITYRVELQPNPSN